MISLFLALASSAMVSIAIRLSKNRVSSEIWMSAANYFTCLSLAAFFMVSDGLLTGGEGLPAAVGFGSINGVLYMSGLFLMQYNIRENGVVLSAIFSKLGLLVPLVVSLLVFHEQPTLLQSIGFVVAVAAMVAINYEKGQGGLGFRLTLPLLLLAEGGASTMSKVFDELGNAELSPQFLFCTFLVALLGCVGIALRKGQRPGLAEIGFGVLIGIPNFFNARFVLKALESVPAVIVYPTCGVGAILLVSLAGVLFFRERLVKRQWIAMAAILTALVMLNV